VERRGVGAVVAAELAGMSGWTLTLRGGERHRVTLDGASLIHPRLLILVFRGARLRRWRLLLPNDALEPDVARQLRLRLRVGALSAHDSGRGV